MSFTSSPAQDISCESASALAPYRLSEYVRTALDQYFAHLDGERAGNLYELVISEVERPLLACVMDHCEGNQTRAASALGLNRATLRKKLRAYGLV